MFKRTFFGMVGLGAGVALGIWTVRRVDAARARMTPQGMADTATRTARGLRQRVDDAVAEGRRAAAEKESELRGVYRVDDSD